MAGAFSNAFSSAFEGQEGGNVLVDLSGAAGASCVASTVAPTVVLGSLVVAPMASTAIASTAGATVVLGSVVVAPTACTAIASTVDPTVQEGGNVVVTPTEASAVASTVAPGVLVPGLSTVTVEASAVSPWLSATLEARSYVDTVAEDLAL